MIITIGLSGEGWEGNWDRTIKDSIKDPSQEVGGLHIVRDRAAQGLGHLGLGIRPPPISKILKGSKAFHYINNRPLKLYKSV